MPTSNTGMVKISSTTSYLEMCEVQVFALEAEAGAGRWVHHIGRVHR
jgi:hypothetical protein